jgi:RNA polymerase sigma factor (sigma-70 family)
MAEPQEKPDVFEESGRPAAGPVETLFREHNETLLRFLRLRLNSEADAREAAQEAYVRMLQLDSPDQPSFLRAYLFKVAANVATDFLRSRGRRNRVFVGEIAEAPEPAPQERALSARQQLDLIELALHELPPRCQEAFRLSRHEGWSSTRISTHLHVSDRMVRLYLVRALEHVQTTLDRFNNEVSA